MRFASHSSLTFALLAAAFLLSAESAHAASANEPQLSAPQLGLLLEPDGSLRALYGFGATLLPGELIADKVLSAGCGTRLCFAKRDTELMVFRGTLIEHIADVPAGEALFAFAPAKIAGGEEQALLYFPARRSVSSEGPSEPALAEFAEGRLNLIESYFGLTPDDVVLSIRIRSNAVEAAVRRETMLRIIDRHGATLDTLPHDSRSANLLADGSIVYATGDELIFRAADRHETRHPISGITALQTIGHGYLAATSPTELFAIDTGEPALLFRLPFKRAPRTPSRRQTRSDAAARLPLNGASVEVQQ